MTVLETIQRSTDFLAKKGVESPRLQSELLLAHVLKMPRMRLYLEFEKVLTPDELEGIRAVVMRRSRREPLQHIVGMTSFCGLEMIVSRHVLIPRPETELLAELGWNFLNSRVTDEALPYESNAGKPQALDYGTGSGCLAVTLASKCPRAAIKAVDISTNSIEVARQNASQHGVAERICFLVGDGFSALPAGSTFDLIISNPPYIPSQEIQSLQEEVRDFDPRLALDGGPDGLDHYRRLAASARPFLRNGGKLMLEIGDSQSDRVRDLLEQQNWIVERLVEDYTHRPRIVIAHDKCEPQSQSQQNE